MLKIMLGYNAQNDYAGLKGHFHPTPIVMREIGYLGI